MSVDKKDNLDNKDSLEKIIDELCQRAYKLDVATAFIKGILSLLRYLSLFCVIKFQ